MSVPAAAVRAQIASGTVGSVYLILGEDEVEKSALASEFADLVDEGLRAFNVERIHAGDYTTGDRLLDGVGGSGAADGGACRLSGSPAARRQDGKSQAAARRRRSTDALRARAEAHHRRRCAGGRRSGAAAGSLGAYQRDRERQRGRSAAPAGA